MLYNCLLVRQNIITIISFYFKDLIKNCLNELAKWEIYKLFFKDFFRIQIRYKND